MRPPRFRVRTVMIAVAVVALALGGVQWARELRRRSDYYAFVAQAYELEAKNHTTVRGSYREWADERRRPDIVRSQHYQDFPLFSNNYNGRLTTARQDECDVYAVRQSDPVPERDEAKLRDLSERERVRAEYFARLGLKYRRAAARPWLLVGPDPRPPE